MAAKTENKNRSVLRVLYAEETDMGGIPLRQPLPTRNVEQIDPFLLLHHAKIKISKNRDPKHSGVGPHPHRGFSPVTFVFEGGVHHRDSRGNSSIVTTGGTQWMNAGMGIIHSERPPQNIRELGGWQEIVQLWINTPEKHKMDPPEYFPLSAKETPRVPTGNNNVDIRIVSGLYQNIKGPIPSKSPLLALRIIFKKAGKHFFELPDNHNAFIYLLDGKVRIEGYGTVEGLNLIHFKDDGNGINIEAQTDTRCILMAGVPLNEPVVNYGPFVMNSTSEVMEAMRDYQMGKMGVLIEEDL